MCSVGANLGALGFFKYFDFFAESLVEAAGELGYSLSLPTLRVVLPVGISFYTFQTLSYTIDVYRGRLASTERFLDFLLFVSFFPQLVAGPIERASHLLPQLSRRREPSWAQVTSGFQLMAVGFFKKMVIADNMAPIANQVFAGHEVGLGSLLIGVYAFAFQIYCDFSGYTDVARGAARTLGIDLCENFKLPYLATNPSDFWRRWHVSLSTWLRDYLYIPLGGNRHGARRTLVNLCATMLLGGLWHGASWHFVLWGAYHGLLLVVFRALGRADAPSPVGAAFWLRVAGFFQLTALGWLIFRVESVSQLGAIFVGLWNHELFKGLDVWEWQLTKLTLAATLLMASQVYQHLTNRLEPWTRWPTWARAALYVVLYLGLTLLGATERHEFIYFQF